MPLEQGGVQQHVLWSRTHPAAEKKGDRQTARSTPNQKWQGRLLAEGRAWGGGCVNTPWERKRTGWAAAVAAGRVLVALSKVLPVGRRYKLTTPWGAEDPS